jgi:hypothetical protein
MMSDMGQPRRRTGRATRAGAVVACAVLAAGCSTGDVPDDEKSPSAESAALRMETVFGAGRLDEQTVSELEGEVGDVLSDYVVEAFLGEFPRDDFVQSFESFTSRAARDAAGRIEVLTASSAEDATAMRATQLDARLSFLTQRGTVHAGSAAVHFAFEATMEDGSTRPLVLDGRFLLEPEDDRWRIFGYDLTLDDGIAVEAES